MNSLFIFDIGIFTVLNTFTTYWYNTCVFQDQKKTATTKRLKHSIIKRHKTLLSNTYVLYRSTFKIINLINTSTLTKLHLPTPGVKEELHRRVFRKYHCIASESLELHAISAVCKLLIVKTPYFKNPILSLFP